MCEPHLEWLKHNSEPWTDVFEHWEASRLARIRDITTWDGNIHLLFTKWPILKHPQGYTLVNILYCYNILYCIIVISKSS